MLNSGRRADSKEARDERDGAGRGHRTQPPQPHPLHPTRAGGRLRHDIIWLVFKVPGIRRNQGPEGRFGLCILRNRTSSWPGAQRVPGLEVQLRRARSTCNLCQTLKYTFVSSRTRCLSPSFHTCLAIARARSPGQSSLVPLIGHDGMFLVISYHSCITYNCRHLC